MNMPRTNNADVNRLLELLDDYIQSKSIALPQPGWTETEGGLIPPKAPSTVIDYPFRLTRATVNGVNGVHVSLGTADDTYQVRLETLSGDELDFDRSNNFLPTWSSEAAQRALGNGAIVLHWYVDDTDEWTGSVDGVTLEWFADTAEIPYPVGVGMPDPLEHWYAIVGYDSPDGISNVIKSHVRVTRLGQSGNDWCVYSIA